jgi:hypothetical protein
LFSVLELVIVIFVEYFMARLCENIETVMVAETEAAAWKTTINYWGIHISGNNGPVGVSGCSGVGSSTRGRQQWQRQWRQKRWHWRQ